MNEGRRVVTVIEVLSPAYKLGNERRAGYVHKQKEYLEAGVNLVAIDLVHEGDYVLSVPWERLPSQLRTPYLVCVRRAVARGHAELYGMSLREPLPNIRIPLRPSDRDVALQLQPLIDACYRDGRYHRIYYRANTVPCFGEVDNRWID